MRARQSLLSILTALLAATVVTGAEPIAGPDGVWVPPAPVPGGRWLRVLHVNDLHGNVLPRPYLGEALPASYRGRTIGGLTSAAGYLARVRRLAWRRDPGRALGHALGEGDGVLFLDAGDWFGGTLYGAHTRGRVTAEVMVDPALDLDATVVGNHAWDYQPGGLEGFLEVLEGRVPVLCANLLHEDSPVPGCRPWVVVEEGGVRVGLIGILAGDALEHTLPERTAGYRVTDPLAALRRHLPVLRAQSDVVIGLFHCALDLAEEAARQVAALDDRDPEMNLELIVDGHSHSNVTRRLDEDTLLVQADHYGVRLGEVLLEVGPDRRATGRVHARRLVLDAAELPPARGMLERHHEHVAGRLLHEEAPVARAEPGLEIAHPLRSEPDLVSDCGDLVARAFLEEVRRVVPEVEAAVINQGGVRMGLYGLDGVVTRAAVHAVLPFANEMVVLRPTGAQLEDLVRRGIDAPQRMSFAGLVLTVREGEAGVSGHPDRSLVSLRLRGPDGRLEPLDPHRRYGLVTSSYLGAHAFPAAWQVPRRDLDFDDAESLRRFLGRWSDERGAVRAAELRVMAPPSVELLP